MLAVDSTRVDSTAVVCGKRCGEWFECHVLLVVESAVSNLSIRVQLQPAEDHLGSEPPLDKR